jgi:hypothetical protein
MFEAQSDLDVSKGAVRSAILPPAALRPLALRSPDFCCFAISALHFGLLVNVQKPFYGSSAKTETGMAAVGSASISRYAFMHSNIAAPLPLHLSRAHQQIMPYCSLQSQATFEASKRPRQPIPLGWWAIHLISIESQWQSGASHTLRGYKRV